MYKRILLAFMLATMSLGIQIRDGDVPEVHVILQTGDVYDGRVLFVRDSSIVFFIADGTITVSEQSAIRQISL